MKHTKSLKPPSEFQLEIKGSEKDMDDEDRISSKPEEIRNHIVSFLPMEEAIRTSILSTKWRKVCSSLSNFDFSQGHFEWDKGLNLQQFEEVVYQTISQHDSSDINNFSLSIASIQDHEVYEFQPHLNQWISFAVNHNVRELVVWGEREVLEHLSVCFVTSCNSLKELNLMYINLNLFPNVRFPNLTTLFLGDVEISSASVINQLFSNCLVLESLIMCYIDLEEDEEDHSNDFTLIIPSPNLKVLVILGWPWHRNHQLNFFSKNVHKLNYEGPPPSFGSDIIPSMDEAEFNIITGIPSLNNTDGDNHWASKILLNLCNVTKLHLGTFYLEGTGFVKTQELNTDGMLKQLRSVVIYSFQGNEFELALVSFLLENADVMEKMDVLLSEEYQNDPASSSSIKEKIEVIAGVSSCAVVSVLEIYSVSDVIAWAQAKTKYERNSRREPRQ